MSGEQEVLSMVVEAALGRKAEDVAVLDLTAMGSITDHFVVCHGHSVRQTQAIADAVQETLKQAGVRPGHIEGYPSGEWILMDYGDFVVHVFTEEKRNHYQLEKLWSDAPRLTLQTRPVTARKGGRRGQEGEP
ncbi:MAG TPA: ribosome silencing factor [Candidatus Polarisedimenticolia bacterium]|nr:ribosome silencing factor [Candidatus Polarisedimenticolia bacterium]